jgi:ABC-2 type transport system permease protein
VNGFLQHFGISLRLHFRNRMALLYGYLFPLIFLAAFWVLYRHETVPLLRHMGELLTVSVLGGACFGLPTTLVSERERGVWRRYRLAPVGTWSLVASTAVARYVIVLTAGALQLAIALAMGMTAPAHALALFVVFTFVAFAFIGLGLVIAMLADNVPAVQALGQCIFLPMLIIGGVAVPLASLPEWAQHVSAFFPGRYAVEALQACVTGDGFAGVRFELVALAAIGAAGCVTGAKLFRWDAGQHFGAVSGKAWLVPVLAAWVAVGFWAEARGRVAPIVATEPAQEVAQSREPEVQPWQLIGEAEIAAIDYKNIPPDNGLVTPMAAPDVVPDDETDMALARLEGELPHWPPGHVSDPVQRVRNLLCVAGVPDLVQNPVERFVPAIVLQRLEATMPRKELVQVLTWIALHPDEGTVITDLSVLQLDGAGSEYHVRERSNWYAMKFVAKLTGRATD